MTRTEINARTGETRVIPLSTQEIADIEARRPSETQRINGQLDAQINALEHAAMVPRATREFMLQVMVASAAGQGVNEAALYAGQIGYRKVKDADTVIAALRAQRV